MAHAAAEETFKRHLGFWKEHEKEGADLLFWSPADAAIKVAGHSCLEVGKAQHDGPAAIGRFRTILNHLADLPYDRHVFLEYDSFILGKLPALHGDFAGNLFIDEFGPKNGWSSRFFCHPPFMVDANALRKINEQMRRLPMTSDSGMWDRQLGYAIENAGITSRSWIQDGYGFAFNTIEPAYFPSLKDSLLAGARAIHGCKTPECLAVIKEHLQTIHEIDSLTAKGYKICLSDPDKK